jgi:hypothetical protein
MTESYQYLRRNYNESESFEDYFGRVGHLMPNVPPAVLRQLFYDHFESTVERLGWLDFGGFSFSEESWDTTRIITEVTAWNESAVQAWKQSFWSSPDWRVGPLVTYMYAQGTWPVPPVVVDNRMGLCSPRKGPLARWELIEGHHRLAYLRALFENPQWSVKKSHDLWIMTKDTG